MNDRARAFLEAADFAEFYASERMTLCGDGILHDPVLAGQRSREAFEKSAELQVESTINSAAYHAAMHIAEHFRKLAEAA